MKRLILITFLFTCCSPWLLGQIDSTGKKILRAVYIEKEPKIDGLLDDEVWQNAPVAVDFTENTPNPGTAPSQHTEVKVLYTTSGIYIGAKMYATAPDSILKQLSVRDASGGVNADNFAVYIDGMFTQQSAFLFMVTAAGVQVDENDGDENWDAVCR